MYFRYLLHCRNVISTEPLGVCMNTMGEGDARFTEFSANSYEPRLMLSMVVFTPARYKTAKFQHLSKFAEKVFVTKYDVTDIFVHILVKTLIKTYRNLS